MCLTPSLRAKHNTSAQMSLRNLAPWNQPHTAGQAFVVPLTESLETGKSVLSGNQSEPWFMGLGQRLPGRGCEAPPGSVVVVCTGSYTGMRDCGNS